MGYFVVYCPEDGDAHTTDGDEVASNSSYAAFLTRVDTLGDGFGALAGLAEEGAADRLPLW
jgi:hypothetical protein